MNPSVNPSVNPFLNSFLVLAAITLLFGWFGYLIVQRAVHGRRVGPEDAALSVAAGLAVVGAAGGFPGAGWVFVAGGVLAAVVAVLLARAAVRRKRAP